VCEERICSQSNLTLWIYLACSTLTYEMPRAQLLLALLSVAVLVSATRITTRSSESSEASAGFDATGSPASPDPPDALSARFAGRQGSAKAGLSSKRIPCISEANSYVSWQSLSFRMDIPWRSTL
jgi:hypothetical protein